MKIIFPSGDREIAYIERHTLIPPYMTPKNGRLMRFLFDEETPIFDGRSRVVTKNYKQGALPATVQLDGKPDFIPLTREWQELWFECLKWQAGGMMTHDELLEAWRSVTMDRRAFTDQHTRENGYRDWILGVNMNGKDMEQRRLSTAGNIIDALTNGSRVSFRALDLSKPAPKIETIWGNHTLIWWATETDRPKWYEGGRQDINGRWPQLGALGVPFLNISPDGINYVSNTRVQPIPNNVLFSPYHPASAA